MKFKAVIIDWEYPQDRKIPKAEIFDLNNKNQLMEIYMSLANGVIVEARFIPESNEASEVLCKMVTNVGSAKRITELDKVTNLSWLFQEGDEVYQQGSGNDGWIMIAVERLSSVE